MHNACVPHSRPFQCLSRMYPVSTQYYPVLLRLTPTITEWTTFGPAIKASINVWRQSYPRVWKVVLAWLWLGYYTLSFLPCSTSHPEIITSTHDQSLIFAPAGYPPKWYEMDPKLDLKGYPYRANKASMKWYRWNYLKLQNLLDFIAMGNYYR